MAAELRGWTNFFTQLSSFLVSCERHYGLANQQYTEYAIERLSQQCQSIQAILDPIRRAASADLSSLCTSLTQLLEHLHAILNQWEQYSDTLDIQQVRRYCPPPCPPLLWAWPAKIRHIPETTAISAVTIIHLD